MERHVRDPAPELRGARSAAGPEPRFIATTQRRALYDLAFHGKHPAPAGIDAVSVPWAPCDRRTSRVRVRDYTCECLPVAFEFCVAAGLAFIRRRQRSDSQLLVTESDWATRRLADALWADIMRGKAQ